MKQSLLAEYKAKLKLTNLLHKTMVMEAVNLAKKQGVNFEVGAPKFRSKAGALDLMKVDFVLL